MYETTIQARNAWGERRRAQIDAGVPYKQQERLPEGNAMPALPFSPLTASGLTEAFRERCFEAYRPPERDLLDRFTLQAAIEQRIDGVRR